MATLAAVALLGAACSGSDGGGSGSGDASSGTSVTGTVQDFSISVDPSSASAGKVTFEVTNDGPSVHEFVILETALAEDALPVEEGMVPEDSPDLTLVGELEDLEPSSTTTLEEDMSAGSFVIICNIAGHYQQGMHAAFTVE
jgi:uncharacterized cupredoxin-like copper-binding protein